MVVVAVEGAPAHIMTRITDTIYRLDVTPASPVPCLQDSEQSASASTAISFGKSCVVSTCSWQRPGGAVQYTALALILTALWVALGRYLHSMRL